MSFSEERLLETLRCPACIGPLSITRRDASGKPGTSLVCRQCREIFPIVDSIPRLLLSPLREALVGEVRAAGIDPRQVKTALRFGFEWKRFPEMYGEWEQQFLDYMQPHKPEFFRWKKVLDAGCGNGRFAFYAAKYGAEVWAIDVGPAVEVARRNTQSMRNVQVLQADLHRPPFALASFDFIYSLGVLHHLIDPESAFQNLMRYVKPGGEIQIYVYWKPERQPIKKFLLAGVTTLRQVTTRLPHVAVVALAYPAALAAHALFVWPYQILKKVPALSGIVERFPMKQYANFPFRVCVNDQLDRFSAPIENRYTRQEISDWLTRAGLESPQVGANFGWIGSGRKTGTSGS